MSEDVTQADLDMADVIAMNLEIPWAAGSGYFAGRLAMHLRDHRLAAARAMQSDEAVERVAQAIAAALLADCTSDGRCYAVADAGPNSPDGVWAAEVDGEINIWPLARAAIAALNQKETP